MSENPVPEQIDSLREAIAAHRTWFIVLGIVFLLAGFLAIAFPLATTIAVKILLGWLILIAGIFQLLHAFQSKKWKGVLLGLLIGLAYLVVGGWLAFFPLTGVITLTILLAVLFIFQGVLECGLGLQAKPSKGWGWFVFSGGVAILAGVLIIAGLPGTAVWALGVLVGINLLSTGWAYLLVALAVKQSAG